MAKLPDNLMRQLEASGTVRRKQEPAVDHMAGTNAILEGIALQQKVASAAIEQISVALKEKTSYQVDIRRGQDGLAKSFVIRPI